MWGFGGHVQEALGMGSERESRVLEEFLDTVLILGQLIVAESLSFSGLTCFTLGRGLM